MPMLNIKSFYELIEGKNVESFFFSQESPHLLITIALIEQRIVLERIAELLDAWREDGQELGSQLDRIATALEERNNAFKTVVDERPGAPAEPI